MAVPPRTARPPTCYPVPPYLPPPAAAVLPWTRRYVTALTTRHRELCAEDAWDEAVTALLRAAAHFRPGAGTFHAYARTTVVRGLWRYCRRQTTRHPPTIDLDAAAPLLTMPSAEFVVAALSEADTTPPAPRVLSPATSATALRATPTAAARPSTRRG